MDLGKIAGEKKANGKKGRRKKWPTIFSAARHNPITSDKMSNFLPRQYFFDAY